MKQRLLPLCVLIILPLTGCDGIQAPSESQIKEACNIGNSVKYQKIEFGKSITSQGGVTDQGAPAGTKIYPIKFIGYTETYSLETPLGGAAISPPPSDKERRLFKDPFGKWKCQ